MIAARVALAAALAVASAAAHAQPSDASDVAAPLRPAVTAYRQGDTATAERALRSLNTPSADADAWLGAILIDRGARAEGLRLIQRAADAGSAEGEHRLALIYANGEAGIPRDEARAAQLFEKAAEKGNRRAQLNIGTMYYRGQGMPRDLIQSRAWLEKAAADGNVHAIYALGRAMAESAPPASADPARAADLFRQAAERGHMFAALRYGMALSDGAGVKKDQAAAQRWFVMAQQNGVPEGALAMGDMLARAPATRDKAANEKMLKTAISWFEMAANSGVPSGQFKLANAYLAGSGVARDPGQAQFWYGRAAQQGLPEAQQALGVMLLTGTAGATDPVEAFKWLYLAERGGHPEARAVREKVGDKVPDRDRKKAEALAQAFKPISELPREESLPALVPVPAKR
ncbi:MAG: sel1 repeat family protein [Reyranella sp.]|jgi:TPR repeat protein|nr:MAG: sel1 repeat family protein [Reyranella sp.]